MFYISLKIFSLNYVFQKATTPNNFQKLLTLTLFDCHNKHLRAIIHQNSKIKESMQLY